MKPSERIVINTVAQYSRTIINMVLSLYTVRLVLGSLGQSDFGIYTLIAGVVAMLGFITNSLVETTQRFISYAQGEGLIQKTKEIFNNSFLIHAFLGIILAIGLELIRPLLFDGFLNIPVDRIEASQIVYHLVVIILFTTFINAPFKALLVSHENIVYISIVEILDALLKVVLVIIMTKISFDKLVFYGLIMWSVQILNIVALSTYCYTKYEECIFPNFKLLRKGYIKELLSFAGWKIYGTACTVGRQQGISIVLNRIFGTVMNAGWGIGSQISGYTNFLASAVVNAMNPQIIKAEGSGDRERAIWLSNILSKLVFFLMSIIGVPCIFEIDKILTIWLDNPPESASLFSKMFILALLADSMTIGLTHINNAIGKIGKYIVVMGTPKLLTFIFILILLHLGFPLVWGCWVFVLIELFCSLIRIPLIKEQVDINIKEIFCGVIIQELLPLTVCVLTCLLIVLTIESDIRFILTFICSAITYSLSMYHWGLSIKERFFVNQLINRVLSKFRRNGQ